MARETPANFDTKVVSGHINKKQELPIPYPQPSASIFRKPSGQGKIHKTPPLRSHVPTRSEASSSLRSPEIVRSKPETAQAETLGFAVWRGPEAFGELRLRSRGPALVSPDGAVNGEVIQEVSAGHPLRSATVDGLISTRVANPPVGRELDSTRALRCREKSLLAQPPTRSEASCDCSSCKIFDGAVKTRNAPKESAETFRPLDLTGVVDGSTGLDKAESALWVSTFPDKKLSEPEEKIKNIAALETSAILGMDPNQQEYIKWVTTDNNHPLKFAVDGSIFNKTKNENLPRLKEATRTKGDPQPPYPVPNMLENSFIAVAKGSAEIASVVLEASRCKKVPLCPGAEAVAFIVHGSPTAGVYRLPIMGPPPLWLFDPAYCNGSDVTPDVKEFAPLGQANSGNFCLPDPLNKVRRLPKFGEFGARGDPTMAKSPNGRIFYLTNQHVHKTPTHPVYKEIGDIPSTFVCDTTFYKVNPTIYYSDDCGENWNYVVIPIENILIPNGDGRRYVFEAFFEKDDGTIVTIARNDQNSDNHFGSDRPEIYVDPWGRGVFVSFYIVFIIEDLIDGQFATTGADEETNHFMGNDRIIMFSPDGIKDWIIIDNYNSPTFNLNSTLVMTSTEEGLLVVAGVDLENPQTDMGVRFYDINDIYSKATFEFLGGNHGHYSDKNPEVPIIATSEKSKNNDRAISNYANTRQILPTFSVARLGKNEIVVAYVGLRDNEQIGPLSVSQSIYFVSFSYTYSPPSIKGINLEKSNKKIYSPPSVQVSPGIGFGEVKSIYQGGVLSQPKFIQSEDGEVYIFWLDGERREIESTEIGEARARAAPLFTNFIGEPIDLERVNGAGVPYPAASTGLYPGDYQYGAHFRRADGTNAFFFPYRATEQGSNGDDVKSNIHAQIIQGIKSQPGT